LDLILINNLKEDFFRYDEAHFLQKSLIRTIIIPGFIGVQTDPRSEGGPTEQGGILTYSKKQNLQSDWV